MLLVEWLMMVFSFFFSSQNEKCKVSLNVEKVRIGE